MIGPKRTSAGKILTGRKCKISGARKDWGQRRALTPSLLLPVWYAPEKVTKEDDHATVPVRVAVLLGLSPHRCKSGATVRAEMDAAEAIAVLLLWLRRAIDSPYARETGVNQRRKEKKEEQMRETTPRCELQQVTREECFCLYVGYPRTCWVFGWDLCPSQSSQIRLVYVFFFAPAVALRRSNGHYHCHRSGLR